MYAGRQIFPEKDSCACIESLRPGTRHDDHDKVFGVTVWVTAGMSGQGFWKTRKCNLGGEEEGKQSLKSLEELKAILTG